MMNFLRRLFGKKETRAQEAPVSYPPKPPTPLDETPTEPPLPAGTRPLSLPEEYISTTRRMDVGCASDPGIQRPINEDTLLIATLGVEGNRPSTSFGLFVVADGMGGYEGGELASALAVQVITEHVTREITLPWLEDAPLGADQKPILEVLAEAIAAANEAVNIVVPEGGTTATCTIIHGNIVYVAHIGDSRAYLITENVREIEQLTRDHSLAARLVELGHISLEELRTHPERHMLYSAIGKGEGFQVHETTRHLPPASRLLLCSDGLWEVVTEERMLAILRGSPNPQDACKQLVAEANSNGGPDNITVVLVQMPR